MKTRFAVHQSEYSLHDRPSIPKFLIHQIFNIIDFILTFPEAFKNENTIIVIL